MVIGAGAAGHAAASELASANHRVLILEARDRVGGRIFTHRATPAPVPIELGAEFVHGASSAVLQWLKGANQVAVDASRDRWLLKNGRLQPATGVLRELKQRFGRISPPRSDIAFAEFLRRQSRSLPSAVRELACMMVEGFDAADPARISAREVLEEWSGGGAADAPTFRPALGYDTLIQSIRQSLDPDCVTVQLNTRVREIVWRDGRVTIEAQRHGEAVTFRARHAIVTLPLGVLQLPPASPYSVRFAPELRRKRTALARLAAGPVIKVVMVFARPFWEQLEDCRYREAGFFFAPQAPFPTFWTSLPLRTSVLVAWSAGPNASRLAGRDTDNIVVSVMDSLRTIFGRRVDYAALLESASWHDWQRDPFSCGAYSYLVARAASARQSLAAALDDTLFFAGEASDTEDEAGTVGGALQSGARAARQVLESVADSGRRRNRRAR